jgi:IS5 family transposase
MYRLFDEQTQFQVVDRLTFKRFPGLLEEDKIPDQKTRETLTQAGLIKMLFDLFGCLLNEVGCTAQKGKIIDAKHLLIREYSTTSEKIHDSQILEPILDPENTNADVYADSAYSLEKIEKQFDYIRYRSRINKKENRSSPLTDIQQKQNRKKSRVRARIEQVFAQIEAMHSVVIRCIERLRAVAKIGLLNLVYNMKRFAYLEFHA